MKVYDLEERTLQFARDILALTQSHRKVLFSFDHIRQQILRCSSSIGANYLEANDALGKKDFILRLRIARKEAKETIYWLKLMEDAIGQKLVHIIKEAEELRNILSSIIKKAQA